MSRRLFHFCGGTANKFWSIETTGTRTLVHFGRTGTAGQAQEKEWPGEADALAAAAKLISEKTKKGYIEQTGSSANPTVAPTPVAVVKALSKKPKPSATHAAGLSDPSDPGQVASPITVCDGLQPSQLPALDSGSTLHLERRIDLGEQDWWWAGWRPRRVLPIPEVRPFDREACLAKLESIAPEGYSGWSWHLLNLPPMVSLEEAWFWRQAGRLANTTTSDKTLADLAKAIPQPHAVPESVVNWSFQEATWAQIERSLHGVEGMLERHGAFSSKIREGWQGCVFARPFRRVVLPYLTAPEIETLRARLQAVISPLAPPAGVTSRYLPDAVVPAAALKMEELMRQIVSAIPTGYYSGPGQGAGYGDQLTQEVVFGLGSAEEVRSEMRRVSAPLSSLDHVIAWLACTEFADLDLIADAIIRQTNRDDAAKFLRPLLGVHAIEAVPVMFRLMQESKVSLQARQWLFDHPAHAIAGAATLASGGGKIAEAALEFLTECDVRGQRPLIEAALKNLPPGQSAVIEDTVFAEAGAQLPVFDEITTPEWLKEGLPPVKGAPAKLPGSLPVESLPQVAIGALALSAGQMASLLQCLSRAALDNRPAIFAQIRQRATTVSLDAFVWKLFNVWLKEGAPPKQKWAFLAPGYLGSDAIALKLAPLIRKWPGESQHQRAVNGLQVLRMIGTDTALMQLNGIAQKVPFKGLKERARELMEEIAKTRGLTKAELEDRIVPDFGLDDRGGRFFDFGPRRFELLLGSDLKPMIREASGKKRPDLPAPNSSDDPTLAAEAVAEWKLLKKNLREVLKIQTERLEQAMITGRRWTAEEFQTLFVKHPLMTQLSRWIIWACYAPDGRVSDTFRVNDDRTLTDSSEEDFSLLPDAMVGIVHPLQLEDPVKSAWGQIQVDYEIISPFPQLGRPLFALLPEEQSTDTIRRGKGCRIPAGNLIGAFDKNGWVRDYPADAGGYSAHSKPFPAANLTAFAHYDPGLWVGGSLAIMDDQELTEVYFVSGLRGPDCWSSHKDRIPLSIVDPIVLTEVLRDVKALLSRTR